MQTEHMPKGYTMYAKQGGQEMFLADVGNTHFHIYDGQNVVHLSYKDAIEQYAYKDIYYISVKHDLDEKIEHIKTWKNISNLLLIEGEYEMMGVDRKALCLSHDNGVFVDAGSAVTVDVMEDGVYAGGYIFPGIKAMLDAYGSISPALQTTLDTKIDVTQLPCTTKEQISYGIIASIKALIEKHSKGKRVYFTGGDGAFLVTFFEDALYDETLVFKGMMHALRVSEKLKIKN